MRRFLISVVALAGCAKPDPTTTTKAEAKQSEVRNDAQVVIAQPPVITMQAGEELHIVQEGYSVRIRVGTEVPPPPTRKLPRPSPSVVPPIPPPLVPPIPPSGPPVVPPFPPSPPVYPIPLPGGPVMLPGGPSLPVPGR